MNEKKLQINPALSIRYEKNKSIIEIGWTAPLALTIKKPPIYLEEILKILSKPHTLQDIIQKLTEKYSPSILQEAEDVINDLVKLKVICPEFKESRYSRHQLYFNLLNIDPENYQQILSNKTVGLIGTGGIGSTCAMLLTSAGIGKIVILDDDILEESNLTRAILFEESDINIKKVVAAKKRLEARNRHTNIDAIVDKCTGTDTIKKYFSDCDVLLLSADTPIEKINQWTNEASLALGIPYINSGYEEIFGLVGPFFLPGITSCYNCRVLNETPKNSHYTEFNHTIQAPSYGPLNTLVSSITVNEIVRYLLGFDITTRENLLYIDSRNYHISSFKTQVNENCYCRKYNF